MYTTVTADHEVENLMEGDGAHKWEDGRMYEGQWKEPALVGSHTPLSDVGLHVLVPLRTKARMLTVPKIHVRLVWLVEDPHIELCARSVAFDRFAPPLFYGQLW